MDTEDKEIRRKNEALHAYVNEWRGRFINVLSNIEELIVLILKYYNYEAESGKTGHIDFYKKIEGLKEKMGVRDSVLVDFSEGDFFNELHRIREFRNLMAHSRILITKEMLSYKPEEKVGFISCSKWNPEIVYFSNNDFQNYNARLTMVYSKLGDIMWVFGIKRPNSYE
jgi:hypothetical protein